MRVVVSDTSPIRYLVLIDEVELLQKLYGRILIPEAVHGELQQPHTPEMVRLWVQGVPSWVEVVSTSDLSTVNLVSSSLDSGERQAIALALHLNADLLLMDDRAGVEEARRLGRFATGTLGILARGAERGFVSLASALEKLQQTNFRVRPGIIRELLVEEAARSKGRN
jgi:predicted nucleic acid-binding protein